MGDPILKTSKAKMAVFIPHYCKKKKRKEKKNGWRARDVAQWYIACVACARPWVPTTAIGKKTQQKTSGLEQGQKDTRGKGQ
jgi:hypothetical protein